MSGKSLKQKWVCKKGHKQTKTPCSCLEQLLPKGNYIPEYELRSKYVGSRVDRQLPPVADRADEKARFIAKIQDGMDPIEVDILTLRYVYDEDYKDIAKELGLVSPETVIRIHDRALKKLKEKLK